MKGTGLQQMLHGTSCYRLFHLNPGWMHTLCDFALHAIAVFMQLIASHMFKPTVSLGPVALEKALSLRYLELHMNH